MNADFTIRRAVMEDLDPIVTMMEEIKAGMEHPEWYVIDHRDRMRRHIEDEGFILVAETADGMLAAFFMVDFPGARPKDSEDDLDENLGEELCLDDAQLDLVVHMDSAAVRPEYRGHHLQGRLLEAVERELENDPGEYYLCTVHPDNHASLNTMLRHGYVIIRTKEKYGGLRRHVLYKKKERVLPRILVSACLLGVECRYNEKGVLDESVRSLMQEAQLIPVCPELLGGLSTPRDPAERVGDRVVTKTGLDVTAQYEKGAEETRKLAELYGCVCAVLKERSPSCGSGQIYDGTHTGALTEGDGTTAELLSKSGIPVFGESQVNECQRFLKNRQNKIKS